MAQEVTYLRREKRLQRHSCSILLAERPERRHVSSRDVEGQPLVRGKL